MEGTVQGHGPGIKTSPEPDARDGGKLSLRHMAVPENAGAWLSWDEVLERKHSSVHTQTSPNQHYTPGTVLWGQDSGHLPLTLREPSPSVFPEQGTASCSQSNREGRRGKGRRPPSRHCRFFMLLGNKRKQEYVREGPRPPVSHLLWRAGCLCRVSEPRIWGEKLREPASQEALDQQALRRPQTDTPSHGQPGFVLEHS